MHRVAVAILALTVSQQEAPAAPATPPTAAAERQEPPAAPPQPPLPAPPSAPPTEPAPTAAAPPRPAPPPAPPAAPRPPPPPAPAPVPTAAARPVERPSPPPSPPVAAPAPTASPPKPLPEREEVLRAALAFADALVRGDATALGASSAARFSFDGDAVDGREPQVRRWREILGARRAAPAQLRDLRVLPATEAPAALGPPPARIAALLRPGTWIAIADLSGRAVILFLARDGGRMAVVGMSD